MSTDGVQLSARQQRKLCKLENKLAYQQVQNDLRAQYSSPSIFGAQDPYGQMYNPYMPPQQPTNPMQGMMDMMQTMMPMMMMMKMMGIDSGDMFGDMFGGSTKEKVSKPKADSEGWIPDGETTEGVSKFLNKDGSTKEISVTGDVTKTTITDSDNRKMILIDNEEKNTQTLQKKDAFYTQTRDERDKGTSTYKNEVTYSYDDTNDVTKITFNKKDYERKDGDGNKYGKYDVFSQGNKDYYYKPGEGLIEVPPPKKEDED